MILEHGLKSDDIIDPKEGDHIYHCICRYNRINFLKEIINKKFPLDINSLNKYKETPLITAINNKGIECAESMIKLGCDIKIRNKGANINDKNILGETPLSLAQSHQHDDLAMYILQRSKLKFNKKI